MRLGVMDRNLRPAATPAIIADGARYAEQASFVGGLGLRARRSPA